MIASISDQMFFNILSGKNSYRELIEKGRSLYFSEKNVANIKPSIFRCLYMIFVFKALFRKEYIN